MAKIGTLQNGVRRRKRRTTSSKKRKRRNGTTKAQATAFAKKNGLKLVSSRSRSTRTRTKKNGVFGNSKKDAKETISLLLGMGGTKAVGKVVQSFVAPYLSQVGVGKYAEILVDGVLALTVTPMVANKLAGKEASKMARLGGLAIVAVDALELIAPDIVSQYNPFSSTPIVINANGQVGVSPDTVKQLVNATDASDETKDAVAGVMNYLKAGGKVGSVGGSSNSRRGRTLARRSVSQYA